SKQAVLRWADENLHPIIFSDESGDSETNVPEYEALDLASDSAKKTLEPLRPVTAKLESGRSYNGQGVKSYLKRRRKQGLPSLKRVLQESNNAMNKVKRGASFFGLLSQEAIDKVCRFWTERKRYEDQRRTQILPPNRRHLVSHSTAQTPSREASTTLSSVKTTSQVTVQTGDQSLTQSLLLEEKRLEEEEAKEDALLAAEPEMMELTSSLIRAGWQPPGTLRDFIAQMRAQMPGNTSSPHKVAQNIQKVSPAVARRRRRLRAQWLDEQPRPFTPIHLNICRPGLSQDLRMTAEKAQLSIVSTRTTPVLLTDSDKTELQSSKLVGKHSISLPERLTKDILYSQLCCLHWILEQMISGPKDTRLSPIALPTTNTQRTRHSSEIASDLVTISECLEKTASAEQDWFQFICGTDRLTRPRTRNRKLSIGTASNHRSLHSARSFRTDRTDILDQRTPSAKSTNQKQSGNRTRTRVGQKPPSDQKDSAHTNTVQSASTPSSSVFGPMGRPSTNTQSEEDSGSTLHRRLSSVNSTALEMRPKVRTDENEEDEELITTACENQQPDQFDFSGWISARDVRDRYSRVVLSEMAKQIELDLEREIANERMEKLHRIPKRSILERPRTTGSVQVNTNEVFRSEKLAQLCQTMRARLTAVREQMSLELQDRLMYMRELRSRICLGKYQSIPTHAPNHQALKQLHHEASYSRAVHELAYQYAERKQLAAWYLDLIHDLSDMQNDEKIYPLLKLLIPYAQFPTSQFTVAQFLRVLRTMTVWELCSPMVASAIEFVRGRILDMTLEEHVEWLKKTHSCLGEQLP
ncbi:hypothetical protein FGIG_05663, partial [Fasciola gigantica]